MFGRLFSNLCFSQDIQSTHEITYLLVSNVHFGLTLSYFSAIIYSLPSIVKPLPNCQLVNVILLNSDYHGRPLIFNKAERLVSCVQISLFLFFKFVAQIFYHVL